MGRWAQAHLRGTVGPGATQGLIDWPGGDVVVVGGEENEWIAGHSLNPSGLWDRWEIQIRVNSGFETLDTGPQAWPGDITGDTCAIDGLGIEETVCEARARVLNQTLPLSNWSAWFPTALLRCI